MDEMKRQILQAIVDYVNAEFGMLETPDSVENLSNIGLMYTTVDVDGYEGGMLSGEHDIQWVADLEKNPYEVRLYVDDLMETSPVAVLTFTPEEMLDYARCLNWDDLFYDACRYGEEVIWKGAQVC